MPLPLRPLLPQGKEGPQSLPVEGCGIELDSGGKQRCLIKALKALSLAFSRLSCSVSLSIYFVFSLLHSISYSSCYGCAGLRLHPLLLQHDALLI